MKGLLGVVLLIYAPLHRLLRNAQNSRQFEEGEITKDDWVMATVFIDGETLLIGAVGLLLFAMIIWKRLREHRNERRSRGNHL